LYQIVLIKKSDPDKEQKTGIEIRIIDIFSEKRHDLIYEHGKVIPISLYKMNKQ
jgi:hypothetical protein